MAFDATGLEIFTTMLNQNDRNADLAFCAVIAESFEARGFEFNFDTGECRTLKGVGPMVGKVTSDPTRSYVRDVSPRCMRRC